MARALTRLGFRVTRQTGSHRIYVNDKGCRVTLPYHARQILHPKLLTSILRDVGISADELRDLV